MIVPAIKTHYSLLSGFIKPEEAALKCKELGYSHCLLLDDNLSGMVDFFSEMESNGIIPIIGLEKENQIYIAKNHNGYKDLIKIASGINKKSNDILVYDECDIPIFRVYYADKKDCILHRIMLCVKYKTTMKEYAKKVAQEDLIFFKTDEFYFKKIENDQFNKEVISAGEKLINELESYTIFCKPKLPKVDTGGLSENDKLLDLCRKGWKKKCDHLRGGIRQKYIDRVKSELEIITKYNLSGYFLIVYDILNYVEQKGWMRGIARGSAGGSIVSYLLNIILVDPIRFNLLFSRFLNAGRFTKDKVSLPDIDIDIPKRYRDEIIDYLKDKYGLDKVSQMITFGRLKGKSAIKEVNRVMEYMTFSEINELTENFPDEAMVADELEEMEVKSVIMWALENYPKKMEKWCYLKDGKIAGEYEELFNLAIRLENTYKSLGKHPAGVIISNESLTENAPVVYKDNEPIIGLEMNALDKIGLVKFDILAVNILDKLMWITEG